MGQQLSRSTTPQSRRGQQLESDVRARRFRTFLTSLSASGEITDTTASASHRSYVEESYARLHKINEEHITEAHLRPAAVTTKSRGHILVHEQENPEEFTNTGRHRPSEADATRPTRNRRRSLHDSQTSTRTRQLQADGKTECTICTDTGSNHDFPARPPTSQCQHETNACHRCLRTWIASEFKSKPWNEINCPTCSARMQYEDMRNSVPREIFLRYDKLHTRAAFSALPNFTWCISPRCKSGQLHKPLAPKFRCRACKTAHCVRHGVSWHRGETCKGYDRRMARQVKKAEDVASEEMIRQTTKKCPKCSRNIEKSHGCEHMTCAKCKHQFCWQCLVAYPRKYTHPIQHLQGCSELLPDPLYVW